MCSEIMLCVCDAGYVIGRAAGSCNKGFMSLFNMKTLTMHNVVPHDPEQFVNSCQKKKFIVKAQLPISKSCSESAITWHVHRVVKNNYIFGIVSLLCNFYGAMMLSKCSLLSASPLFSSFRRN